MQGTFAENGYDSMEVFLAGKPYSGLIYASYGLNSSTLWNDDDFYKARQTGCFELTCKLGITPYFESTYNTSEKESPPSVINTDGKLPYIEVIGSMTISEQTV